MKRFTGTSKPIEGSLLRLSAPGVEFVEEWQRVIGRYKWHYDGIKSGVAYRRDVAETCGVGFDVRATLSAIKFKLESYTVTASTC